MTSSGLGPASRGFPFGAPPVNPFIMRLQKMKRALRVTIGELATMLAISPGTLSKWMSGRSRPGLKGMKRIELLARQLDSQALMASRRKEALKEKVDRPRCGEMTRGRPNGVLPYVWSHPCLMPVRVEGERCQFHDPLQRKKVVKKAQLTRAMNVERRRERRARFVKENEEMILERERLKAEGAKARRTARRHGAPPLRAPKLPRAERTWEKYQRQLIELMASIPPDPPLSKGVSNHES